METYEARPAYQQNDYIGWIERAKRLETKQKPLTQILDELRRGGVYMRIGPSAEPTTMPWQHTSARQYVVGAKPLEE